jgi:hypothetical protein
MHGIYPHPLFSLMNRTAVVAPSCVQPMYLVGNRAGRLYWLKKLLPHWLWTWLMHKTLC